MAASRASDDEEEVEDYSFVWRPGIDGSRNTYDDVRNSLIETVRDSALDLPAASDDAVKQVVDILMQHRFTVFGRIALFVLRERPVLPIIEAMLTNRGNFDALGFRRGTPCCFATSSCSFPVARASSCSLGLPKHPIPTWMSLSSALAA